MGKKYYAVRVGRNPNIYTSWAECQAETKGFPKAVFKGFDLLADAQKYMEGISYGNKKVVAESISKDIFEGKSVPAIEYQEYTRPVSRPVKLPENVIIYTDGSCYNAKAIKQNLKNKDGITTAPGGYAAVFLDETGTRELMRIAGGSQETTNNRMELMAVKEALNYLDDGTRHHVKLISDSEYIVKSINQGWLDFWRKKSTQVLDEVTLRKRTGELVKNQDLLKDIDALRKKQDIEFVWTKAHVNTKYNELCDQLAKHEAEEQQGIKDYKENQAVREELEMENRIRSAQRESVRANSDLDDEKNDDRDYSNSQGMSR